ncbi:hypothetical protein ACN4EG_08480 [Alkalinema pantanalense CENA528]|uniref:hypothetical protein n=1 Tax=Alkalinema pantanalense TaxID=1620705 RepID=UPI003D6EC95B
MPKAKANNETDVDNDRSRTGARAQRKRLNLDLAPAAYESLQELAEESGKNMAEILRTGLALYAIAQEAKSQGRSLGVIEGDRVIKEIVIPD